jgi:hypothetical protein
MSSTDDLVSPELVLIDSRLALGARKMLSEPDDTLLRLGQPRLARPRPSTSSSDAPFSADAEFSAALRRIIELSDVEPDAQPRRRIISFATVTAAWAAVVIVAANLELGLYQRFF